MRPTAFYEFELVLRLQKTSDAGNLHAKDLLSVSDTWILRCRRYRTSVLEPRPWRQRTRIVTDEESVLDCLPGFGRNACKSGASQSGMDSSTSPDSCTMKRAAWAQACRGPTGPPSYDSTPAACFLFPTSTSPLSRNNSPLPGTADSKTVSVVGVDGRLASRRGAWFCRPSGTQPPSVLASHLQQKPRSPDTCFPNRQLLPPAISHLHKAYLATPT